MRRTAATGRQATWSVLLALAAVLCALPSCSERRPAPIALTIGTTTSEVNGLLLIAEENGYLAENGLHLTQRVYGSGAAALDGVLAGELDLATGSEFAFVGEVLAGRDVRALASIARSSIEYLVARGDPGIQALADLKGRRVGVPLQSRPEFALDRFLTFRGIDPSQVRLIDVPVKRSVEALAGGEVDAVATWQPYVDQIHERLGESAVAWSVQQDQPSYTLLMARSAWTAGHADAIARLLRALSQAEAYVADQPDAARAAIANRLEYSPDYIASVWADYEFTLDLDQSLVAAMEDQARWIIAHQLSDRAETPNFVSSIYMDGLEAVKPEAVSIIH
jgi:NitT/TauT family transport system substrate-binding protein